MKGKNNMENHAFEYTLSNEIDIMNSLIPHSIEEQKLGLELIKCGENVA